MEAKDYLSNYYEHYNEDGQLASRHGMVEYITTMKYVEQYQYEKYHLATCERQDMIGYSHHTLDIFRKN